MKDILKKTGINSVIVSIIFLILGIILIIKPTETIKVVSVILGVMFVLIGLYKIYRYIKNSEKYNLYNYDIAYGVIAIIIGILTIIYGNKIGNIFRILIGIWIIYSSIIRTNLSFKLKNIFESNIWIYSLIISILMFVCGIFIILNSGIVIMTIGISIVIYSILDLIESIIFLKNIKKIENI